MSDKFIDINVGEVPSGIPILIKQQNGRIFIGIKQSNGEFRGTAIGYYKDNTIYLFNGSIINNVDQWSSIIIE